MSLRRMQNWQYKSTFRGVVLKNWDLIRPGDDLPVGVAERKVHQFGFKRRVEEEGGAYVEGFEDVLLAVIYILSVRSTAW